MRTVANSTVLASLLGRLASVDPRASRRWGTMTPQQMLSHLGDGAEAVLGRRPFSGSSRRPNRLLKIVALRLPLRWPQGVKAGADPAAKQLDDGAFEVDRARAVRTLEEVASAGPGDLVAHHPIFGTMTRRDWHRWAYLHTDHHLRQFGC